MHKVTSLAELAEMDVKALGAVMGEVGARKLHAFLHKNTADFKAVRGSKYVLLWVACDDWKRGGGESTVVDLLVGLFRFGLSLNAPTTQCTFLPPDRLRRKGSSKGRKKSSGGGRGRGCGAKSGAKRRKVGK